MNIDASKQIGAVGRQVKGGDHEGKPAKSVVLAQTYSTPAEDLWDAITNGERIPRWLMPITGDLTLGGRYQLVGNAGGTILECDRPRFLKVTWEYGGMVSWVTATIERVSGASSRLTIEHLAHVHEHWTQFGPGAVGIGWDLMVLGLAQHIETKREDVAAEGLTWVTSPAGKAFVVQSGEAWCEADVAGGADPEAARGASDRTIAAYTGS